MAGTVPFAPLRVVCFTDQTADETLGPWIPVRGATNITFYCSSTGTTSSGVISFEEATQITTDLNGPVFGAGTGGYGLVSTATVSDFTGGLQKAYHLPTAAYGFVRARISTAIGGGGSVTVVTEAS